MAKDYYSILGVPRDASQDDIKRAFRKLARKHHPDVNPSDKNAEAKFKEINEAFQALGDPAKRAQYDQFGNVNFGSGGFRTTSFDEIFSDFGFGDIFNAFGGFGGRRRSRNTPTEGEDVRYDADVSLEGAFSGVLKKIEIPMLHQCKSCGGTGAERGKLRKCPACGGTGEVQQVRRSGFIQMINITACGQCRGTGKLMEKACPVCNGDGVVTKPKKIEVKVPAGVRDESFLRIAGEGEPGKNGGDAGDLYVVIHVKPHEIFDREENDLFCKVTISLSQAILGTEIRVPTINGHAGLKIPAGTQSHTIFRLKGQGMPILGNHDRGDELVKVVVKIPTKLTANQEELLKKFMEEQASETRVEKGFFERMKEQFIRYSVHEHMS